MLPLVEKFSWTKQKEANRCFFVDNAQSSQWNVERSINTGEFKKVRILTNQNNEYVCLLTPTARDATGEKLSKKVYEEKKEWFDVEVSCWGRISQLNLNCMAKVNALVVYNEFTKSDRYGILMHYYPKGDLLRAHCSFQDSDKMNIAHKILKAVGELHQRNIVHKDIKEENLLLEERDGGLDVKIIDVSFMVFDANEEKNYDLTFRSSGTRSHMAPELLKKEKNDCKSEFAFKIDAYSVGVVLKNFITDRGDLEEYASLTRSFVDGSPVEKYKLKVENGRTILEITRALDVWLQTYASYGNTLRKSNNSFSRIVGNLLAFNPADRMEVSEALVEFEQNVMPKSV